MMPDLNVIWYIIVGILFTGYAILDGFDFGVGILHLFIRQDHHRRIFLNAIGPVWDGNEVWLVTAGGALFAAFPEVYATVFSGLYMPFVFLLFALIFRAVAIEFRSKQELKWWRNLWDMSFGISSLLASFLIGVTLGNLVWGLPLDSHYEYIGGFFNLLHPYALLTGITTTALFMMHGAIFLVMKTEGDLQKQVEGWINNTIIFFIMCYTLVTLSTLIYIPHMLEHLRTHPALFAFVIMNMLTIANIPREIHRRRAFRAFLSSSAAIISMMALFGLGMFPDLVYASTDPAYSLTLTNAASSRATLQNMLIIACIGMPLVVTYTFSIYWIFRGKVKLTNMSY